MDAEAPRADPTATADAPALSADALAAALGVSVHADGGEPGVYRFQQAVRFADGLQRRGVLDLAARRFRSTLWAGDHRCLDHLEIAELHSVACDPVAGRLVLQGASLRLVLSRQGAITIVPLDDSQARAARRPTAGPSNTKSGWTPRLSASSPGRASG